MFRRVIPILAALFAVFVFAGTIPPASASNSCVWVEVDADNDPGTPPISVYGYWTEISDRQALIVCDPETDEPVRDAEGKGIAYVNSGQYTETEVEVLDKYERKQIIDWKNPKQVQPLQLSLFAPNISSGFTYSLEDIKAHGGVWARSSGNCLTWGQSDRRARLLANDSDDWLFVLSITNPNPFPASGEVESRLKGWLTWNGSVPISKAATISLGPGETKYMLVNRGLGDTYFRLLAEETSSWWYGSVRQGFSLAYLWSRNVGADVSGENSDFPDVLKPAKGFYLVDPDWAVYPKNVWPLRFKMRVECSTYCYTSQYYSTRSDPFKGYVWIDEEGRFHAEMDPECAAGYRPDAWWLRTKSAAEVTARVENWFNSHKITDIPLVCWYGGGSREVDGFYFDYCRPDYWWPDTRGAFASWWEQTGPVLVGPGWQNYEYVGYWPRPTPKWDPVREENPAMYRVFGRDYQVGERTLWWASDGGVPKVLPVVKARLMFVHRYSWVPLGGDTGLLKKDVVPGYDMWVSQEAAPKLLFSHPLKRITAIRHQYQRAESERSPYGDYRTYIYWLATTWVWEPGKGWIKTGESTSKYENGWGQPTETWGRDAFFDRYCRITPAVWSVRVEYANILNVSNTGYIAGEFNNANWWSSLTLYDPVADAIRGSLYNLYNVWYGSSNSTPAVANLQTPGGEVAVPPVQVEPNTTAPKWQQDQSASVTVARVPWEDPNTALDAFLAAVQNGLPNGDAVFNQDWDRQPRFVLRPGESGGWSLDNQGNKVPTEWIKGFGSVNWAYKSGDWGTYAILGTPESDFTRYSYFRGDFVGHIALPNDVFLKQAERATVWPIRSLSNNWSGYWPFIDPWRVRYWNSGSQSYIVQ